MNRNDSSRSFGRIGVRATTFAGLAAATAAFVSLRGGFFTRGASAEFARPAVAFDALQDGVIEVPTEATSIQAAIDFAPDGSTIRVAAGTYAGGIHCDGKAITIAGAGAESTLLRGFANSPVISFSGDESNRVILSGVSVVGGRGDAGCGVFLGNVTFDVRDSHIAGNQGAGAVVMGSPLTSLTWLANQLSVAGHGLAADALVITGTLTGNLPVKSGDKVDVEWLGLARLALLAV